MLREIRGYGWLRAFDEENPKLRRIGLRLKRSLRRRMHRQSHVVYHCNLQGVVAWTIIVNYWGNGDDRGFYRPMLKIPYLENPNFYQVTFCISRYLIVQDWYIFKIVFICRCETPTLAISIILLQPQRVFRSPEVVVKAILHPSKLL